MTQTAIVDRLPADTAVAFTERDGRMQIVLTATMTIPSHAQALREALSVLEPLLKEPAPPAAELPSEER